jgi:superfamily II DNA or RNA helicase
MLLRSYQEELIFDRLYGELEKGTRRIVVCSATGSGKTVMFCQVIKDAVEEGCPVMVVVHLEQLIGQTVEKLRLTGINPDLIGVIAGGRPENLNRPIQVSSVQSLARRFTWRDRFCTGICLLDEAHLTAWRKVIEDHFFGDAFDGVIVGWSATPTRLKRTEGFDRFEVLLEAPSPEALTEAGFLSPLRYWTLPAEQRPDLTGVHTVGGDYQKAELETAVNDERLLNHAVLQWKRHAEGRPTLAFCVSVAHATALTAAFHRHGVSAQLITGETPVDQRREMFTSLCTGATTVLCSIDVLSIGADLPLASCILCLRPTKSLAVWLQIIGRGARISPETGKADCIVLDCTGCNVQRHGFLTTPRAWSLAPGADPTNGEPPTRECDNCGAVVHASVPKCPECGFVFPRKEKRAVVTNDMVEVPTKPTLTKPHRRLQTLARQGFKAGYLPHWTVLRFEEEFGYAPPSEFWLGALFSGDVSEAAIVRYAAYMGVLARMKDRQFSLALTALIREFGPKVIEPRMALVREVFTRAHRDPDLTLQGCLTAAAAT